jgi:ferredoxin
MGDAAMAHLIAIENSGETYSCREDSNLLVAMESLCRKGIPVGCRNGGCGVCKVQVLDGRYVLRKASRSVLSAEEEGAGLVLACRTSPRSAMRLRVVGKMVRTWEVTQPDDGGLGADAA